MCQSVVFLRVSQVFIFSLISCSNLRYSSPRRFNSSHSASIATLGFRMANLDSRAAKVSLRLTPFNTMSAFSPFSWIVACCVTVIGLAAVVHVVLVYPFDPATEYGLAAVVAVPTNKLPAVAVFNVYAKIAP